MFTICFSEDRRYYKIPLKSCQSNISGVSKIMALYETQVFQLHSNRTGHSPHEWLRTRVKKEGVERVCFQTLASSRFFFKVFFSFHFPSHFRGTT